MTIAPAEEAQQPAEERKASFLAFLAFFFLLAAYFMLRPLREAAGVAGGTGNIKYLFLGTFGGMLLAVPLQSFLVARFPRRRLLAWTFRFFALNVLLFAAARGDDEAWSVARPVFYCWLSVFNLFAVSLYWSVLVDVFDPARCRRLFGLVATGGSLGAIAGSLAIDLGIASLGAIPAFVAAALLLEAARAALDACGRCVAAGAGDRTEEAAVGGGLLEGLVQVGRSPYLLLIAAFLLLTTAAATVAYFEQANLVDRAWPDDEVAQTRFFSRMNLTVQILTLIVQALVTGAIVRRFGPGGALLVLPLVCALGFLVLGAATIELPPAGSGFGFTMAALAAFQVMQQAASRGLASPTRQMLFAPLGRSEKYRAKNFIDTVVYRGGDALTGFAFDAVIALGVGLAGAAFLALPLCLLWLLVARAIHRRQA